MLSSVLLFFLAGLNNKFINGIKAEIGSLNINSVDNSIIEAENDDDKNDLENTDGNKNISLDTSVGYNFE